MSRRCLKEYLSARLGEHYDHLIAKYEASFNQLSLLKSEVGNVTVPCLRLLQMTEWMS